MFSTWQIRSEFEVPMNVDAPDWRTALCLGLQLLEREHLVERLRVRMTGGGRFVAHDPVSGEDLFLEQRHVWPEAVRQAA